MRSTEGTLNLSGRERRLMVQVGKVGRRWPFGRGPCLRESLAAGVVLRRHSPILRFGVARPGVVMASDPVAQPLSTNGASARETPLSAGLVAHAWLEVGSYTHLASTSFTPLLVAGRALAK